MQLAVWNYYKWESWFRCDLFLHIEQVAYFRVPLGQSSLDIFHQQRPSEGYKCCKWLHLYKNMLYTFPRAHGTGCPLRLLQVETGRRIDSGHSAPTSCHQTDRRQLSPYIWKLGGHRDPTHPTSRPRFSAYSFKHEIESVIPNFENVFHVWAQFIPRELAWMQSFRKPLIAPCKIWCIILPFLMSHSDEYHHLVCSRLNPCTVS